MPGHPFPRRLKNLTAADLAPIWARTDIPTRVIAERLGVSRAAVSAKAKRFGLPSRANNHDSEKLMPDDAFKRMWESGVSLADIQKASGYATLAAVSQRRRAMGLPARTRCLSIGTGRQWQETITLEEYYGAEMARLVRAE